MGDVLAGKYRVERVLGAGGMGVVVAAYHVHLDTKVALKFLLPDALRNPEAVARFVREARAAAKITGEHVARVSDVGQLESGSPYIVMEYLDGLDLSTWIKQRGALPIELAVDFVLQACEALADAHALGIVHRDLKPANLFCVHRSDGQPSIKVLDFGISKFTSPAMAGNDMTRTTALVGSPYYMSPEQLQSSKTVDTRTDIWSLGIILYELMSARLPFEAEAVTELAIKIAIDPTPPVRTFRAEVPPALEQVIATCLEKDRARRYQTVGDLAVALQDFGSKQAQPSVERIQGTLRQAWGSGPTVAVPVSSAPQGVSRPPAPTSTIAKTSASWGASSSTTKPGGTPALAIGGVVLLFVVCAAGGAFVLWKQRLAAGGLATPTPAALVAPSTSPSAVAAPQTLAPSEPSAKLAATDTLAAASTSVASPVASASPIARPATPAPRAAPSPGVAARSPAAVPTAAAPAAAGAKVSCDPPYYFDAQGARIFKKECL